MDYIMHDTYIILTLFNIILKIMDYNQLFKYKLVQ